MEREGARLIIPGRIPSEPIPQEPLPPGTTIKMQVTLTLYDKDGMPLKTDSMEQVLQPGQMVRFRAPTHLVIDAGSRRA